MSLQDNGLGELVENKESNPKFPDDAESLKIALGIAHAQNRELREKLAEQEHKYDCLFERTGNDIFDARRERDSLKLELEASKCCHKKDNEFLIAERDEARKIAEDYRRKFVHSSAWKISDHPFPWEKQ